MEIRENLRDELQNGFSAALEKGDTLSLHTLYSKLRKMNRNISNAPSECVDISDLAENISIAADILLRDSGKTVVFCGNDVSPVYGNRQILTKAILEAISNACIFGNGPLVTVKTTEHNTFVSAEIQSEGKFLLFEGEGLEFIRRTVKMFNGEMFIMSNNDFSSVILTLPKTKNLYPRQNPCFIDLATDRLSPVFIELYGV